MIDSKKWSQLILEELTRDRQKTAEQFRETAEHFRKLLEMLNKYEPYGSSKKGKKAVRQSFQILKLKVAAEIERLMSASDDLTQLISFAEPDIENNPDALEDLRDDYQRALSRQIREQLLSVIEILDHLDVLAELDIEAPASPRYRYNFYRQLRNLMQPLRAEIEAHLLTTYGVAVIQADDLIGKYPPLDVTSIAFREDDSRSNAFVVSRILHNGYSWNGKVLRKISVSVITKKETA